MLKSMVKVMGELCMVDPAQSEAFKREVGMFVTGRKCVLFFSENLILCCFHLHEDYIPQTSS